MRWSRGPGFFGSYTFVNKLGEKGWVDDELAPLCVVSGGRLSRDRLLQRSAGFFKAATLSRMSTSMSRKAFSSDLLLTGLPCPGMMIVLSVAAARLESDAIIIPSMLPPVE